MLLASLLFMAVLFVVGVWCIFLVRGSFNRNAEAAKKREGFARSHLQPEMTTQQQALIRARADERREAAEQRAERWKNLTPSLVNQAFRNFYEDDGEASFDASHISDAFEKFAEALRIKQ